MILPETPYDLEKYTGRFRHFFRQQNPLNGAATQQQLQDAKEYIKSVDNIKLDPEKYWKSKYLYDSAYHPTTGDLLVLPGRMSFQAPGNSLLALGMITFYRTPLQVFGGQWANQSFNATVNYSNAPKPSFSFQDYFVATGSACFAAIGLNKLAQRSSNPLISRLVPFAAVATGNMINLPYIRRSELTNGIVLMDKDGNEVGKSKKMGREAISKVVLCRILMASSSMVFPPVILEYLSAKNRLLVRAPRLYLPLQISLIGVALTFMTPAMCAIWPQMQKVPISVLEPDVMNDLKAKKIENVYFNKGL